MQNKNDVYLNSSLTFFFVEFYQEEINRLCITLINSSPFKLYKKKLLCNKSILKSSKH